MASKWEFEAKSSEKFSVAGVIYALVVLVGDGIQPILRHAVPDDVNNLLFTWFASLVEFGALIPIIIIAKRTNRRSQVKLKHPIFSKGQIIGRLVVIGVIFAVCGYLLLYGLNEVDSVTGILAIKTQPISMIFIGYFMLGERVNYKEILCSLMLILGAIYVASDGTMNLADMSEAVFILLIIPIFWNIGHALAKPLIKSGTLTVTELVFGRIGFVTLFLTLFYLGIQQGTDFSQIFNVQYVLPMVALGLLWLMLHLCWYAGVKRLKLSVISSIVVPTPLVTAVLSFLFENERLYYYHFIGMAIEIFGLYGLVYLQKASNMKKNHKILDQRNQNK